MLSAAIRYVALIFLLGFVLGTIRTLVIMPRTGATAAVLIELPFMLAASWLLANRIVRRARLSPARALAMGALAFVLLMIAEALLALALGNQDLGAWFAGLFRAPGWIGLAGQVAFGLCPLLAALRQRTAG
jgi:hypothetical protein